MRTIPTKQKPQVKASDRPAAKASDRQVGTQAPLFAARQQPVSQAQSGYGSTAAAVAGKQRIRIVEDNTSQQPHRGNENSSSAKSNPSLLRRVGTAVWNGIKAVGTFIMNVFVALNT